MDTERAACTRRSDTCRSKTFKGPSMRAVLQMITALALAAAVAGCGEERAPAPRTEEPGEQPVSAAPAGGGTIEAHITYSGPSDIETVRVNKDVKQCGREQRIEKIVVGPGHGLADAVVSITGSKAAA